MNLSLFQSEIAVVLLGLGVLLADLWLPSEARNKLGYAAAAGLVAIFLYGFRGLLIDPVHVSVFPIGGSKFGMFIQDGLAVYFKQFFLLAAAIVLLMSVEYSSRFTAGISEFYSLTLFALLGMLFAASSNDFVMMFVSLELITITFVVLNSFQRNRMASLEAGVKYLIIGALASAFMVFGIALVFGSAGTTNFEEVRALQKTLAANPVFLVGLLLVTVGLGFKIAAVPFQIWAPDVYQGSPAPATAFLAVGSKAAGIVLLMRVLFGAVPMLTSHATKLLIVVAAITILYGALCAIPQRNIKRLMGYSSIANAGFLLLGVAAAPHEGLTATLYYLTGYLFTVLAAFLVIAVVLRETESEDISVLHGLGHRSPYLALALTLSMVSLAGVPPLAGFFGKFLLLRSVMAAGTLDSSYYLLVAVAVVGVVLSIYYYLGIIRAIYWGGTNPDKSVLRFGITTKVALAICIAGMLYAGVLPHFLVQTASNAVGSSLHPEPVTAQTSAAR